MVIDPQQPAPAVTGPKAPAVDSNKVLHTVHRVASVWYSSTSPPPPLAGCHWQWHLTVVLRTVLPKLQKSRPSLTRTASLTTVTTYSSIITLLRQVNRTDHNDSGCPGEVVCNFYIACDFASLDQYTYHNQNRMSPLPPARFHASAIAIGLQHQQSPDYMIRPRRVDLCDTK